MGPQGQVSGSVVGGPRTSCPQALPPTLSRALTTPHLAGPGPTWGEQNVRSAPFSPDLLCDLANVYSALF